MADDQTPKIIVDDDWKSQAKAEKEKLKETAPPEAAPGESQGGRLPEKVEFDHLLEVLVTQALMYMGGFPDPQTGQAMVALDLAKFHIDLLGVVEEKTKGNLSEDEHKRLDGILQELRLRFVEISEAVAKSATEGTLNPGSGPAASLG
jgi:uncharacterized protein DUF1844